MKYSTYVAILYRLGEYEAAAKQAQIAIAKENGKDFLETTALLQKIKDTN